MTISRFGTLLRRPFPVVLAFLLLITTGGFRASEWTLCVEPDGRVHTESASGDCATEDRAPSSSLVADHLAWASAPTGDSDCGDCVDITGRSNGFRLREESATPTVHLPMIAPHLLLPVGPARGAARPIAPDLPNASALTDRAIATIVLTC